MLGNPLKLIDPSGHFAQAVHDGKSYGILYLSTPSGGILSLVTDLISFIPYLDTGDDFLTLTTGCGYSCQEGLGEPVGTGWRFVAGIGLIAPFGSSALRSAANWISNIVDLAGDALGRAWKRIGEIVNSNTIRQSFPDSCSSACAQMLFRDQGIDLAQDVIVEHAGRPTSAQALAGAMNELWSGSGTWRGGGIWIEGATTRQTVEALNSTGPWIANMRLVGTSMHHSVIVDGFDEAGLLIIRDPAQGTMYKMTYEDFETFWSGYGVFYQP